MANAGPFNLPFKSLELELQAASEKNQCSDACAELYIVSKEISVWEWLDIWLVAKTNLRLVEKWTHYLTLDWSLDGSVHLRGCCGKSPNSEGSFKGTLDATPINSTGDGYSQCSYFELKGFEAVIVSRHKYHE